MGAREERRARGSRARSTRRCATLAEGVRVLAVLLWPYLPVQGAAHAGGGRRGRPTTWASTARCSANGSGRSVDASGGPLFPRVDAPRGVIDTHAHLQGLEGGPGAAIEEAAAAGVERIVCVGDSPELAEEAIGLARAHPGVFATVGLHPHRAELWDDALRARLDALLGDPAAVAVGECGLDYYRDRASRERPGGGLRGPGRARASSTASRS